MAALTASRDTKRRAGDNLSLPALTATTVYGGGIAVITAAGYCTKGDVATTHKAVGVFTEDQANPGASGAVNYSVRQDGWFRFGNSAAGDAIALADVNADCYIVDDQTVAKTDGTGTRSKAGKIRDVDADGVWVEFV
jgi:hypothetical protein